MSLLTKLKKKTKKAAHTVHHASQNAGSKINKAAHSVHHATHNTIKSVNHLVAEVKKHVTNAKKLANDAKNLGKKIALSAGKSTVAMSKVAVKLGKTDSRPVFYKYWSVGHTQRPN